MSILLRLVLFSGSSLALLGVVAWSVRRSASRSRECDCGDRFLLGTLGQLLIASRRSSDAVLHALDRALRELEHAIDAVLVFTPSGDELVCIYASGMRAEHFRDLRLRRDDLDRLPARAAAHRCRARFPHDGDALIPTDRVAIAAPMLDGEALRAVVYVASSLTHAVVAPDMLVRAIESAAAPYAIALEREADRADATYDGLTGLLTPLAFRRILHDEVARPDSARNPVLSLWFIDTDRFKNINDQLGHRTGDGVLQAMASLLRTHLVPDVDLGARNGGDEFCALIRASTKTLAIERAGAFCEAVRSHDFGVPMRVTASVGVATLPYDANGSAILLETADAAMYHSKRNGRDRVSFLVEPGVYATLDAHATRIPRTPPRSVGQWPSDTGDFSARSSPS